MSDSRRVGVVLGSAAAGVVAAVALFVAGCGSGSTATATPQTAATDYASCLRDNGVNIPQLNRSGRPTEFPSGRPTVRPSVRPDARPSGGPDAGPGGFPGGGGFFGSTAPSGVDQQTWEKAQKACASLRPSGFPQGGNRTNGALMAYRNCLSDHGVTVSGPIDELDSKDPKVAAALQACAVLRPSARPSNS